MPNYRRAKFPGGYYFFTVVMHRRKKVFRDEIARALLHNAIEQTQNRRPFEILGLCLLPDHLHCIWKLPDRDADFSIRWASIKGIFSKNYIQHRTNRGQPISRRSDRGEVAIWQRRFWEHQIRDEDDLQRHMNYTHYNPVKHGLVKCVADWPWSTYHKYVKLGMYTGFDPFAEEACDDGRDFGE